MDISPFGRRLLRQAAGGVLSDKYKVKYETLPSGARLVTRRVWGGTHLEAAVRVPGAGYVNAALAGLPAGCAHFLEHVIMHENRRYTLAQMQGFEKNEGWQRNAMTDTNYMEFRIKVPWRQSLEGLAALAETVSGPVMSDACIEIQRETLQSELLKNEMTNKFPHMWLSSLRAGFGSLPFMDSLIETTADFKATTKKHLSSFYDQAFQASRTVIVVQSPLAHKEVRACLLDNFTLPEGEAYKDVRYPFVGGDDRVEKSAMGSRIRLCLLDEVVKDEAARARWMLWRIVAGDLVSKALREQGLVYSFYPIGGNDTDFCCRRFEFDAFPERVERILAVTGEKLDLLANEGAPLTLESHQRQALEGPMNVSNVQTLFLSDMVWQMNAYGHISQNNSYVQKVQEVSNKDIKNITRQILGGPLGFAAMGKLEGLPDPDRVRSLLRMKKTASLAIEL